MIGSRAARLGPDRAVAGLRALFGVWPVGSFDHLHAAEPVLRGARGCSAVLAEPGRTEEYLPAAGPAGPAVSISWSGNMPHGNVHRSASAQTTPRRLR